MLNSAVTGKRIEVINVAMAAVNSYTLLDLIDEVLDRAPDVILIYAVHNEFYGALGVGTVQSLGSSRELINTYLGLRSFRTFVILRDFLGWIKLKIGTLFSSEQMSDLSATLMARIVADQTIPYESDLYNAGINKFKFNLDDILMKVKNRNIPVILSELVSNLRDQKPIISMEGANGKSAEKLYLSAQKEEKESNYLSARIN